VFFNAGCNEQVFSPKPRKKIGMELFCRFREKAKIVQLRRTLILKKWRHQTKG